MSPQVPMFVGIVKADDGLYLLDAEGRVWWSACDSIMENRLEPVRFAAPEDE